MAPPPPPFGRNAWYLEQYFFLIFRYKVRDYDQAGDEGLGLERLGWSIFDPPLPTLTSFLIRDSLHYQRCQLDNFLKYLLESTLNLWSILSFPATMTVRLS